MQLPKVLNSYRDDLPHGFVRIMRPGPWGNPFVIGRDGDRWTVLRKYRVWLMEQLANDSRFRRQFMALADVPALVCCCKPQQCHGDIMVEVLAKLMEGEK